jgi:hypothetical protein
MLSAAITEGGAMTDGGKPPLACRLNLKHSWRRYSTSDGNRYQACERCGRDKPDGGADVHIMLGG